MSEYNLIELVLGMSKDNEEIDEETIKVVSEFLDTMLTISPENVKDEDKESEIDNKMHELDNILSRLEDKPNKTKTIEFLEECLRKYEIKRCPYIVPSDNELAEEKEEKLNEAVRLKAAEEEAARLKAAEEEAARLKAEEEELKEAARLKAEEEAARLKAEEEE